MIIYISVFDDLKISDEETAIGDEDNSPFVNVNKKQNTFC